MTRATDSDRTTRPAVGPVTGADRINSLDTIRGVAILGILPMNALAFGLDQAAYVNVSADGIGQPLDWVIGVLTMVFIDQKMMALFSLLFGVGVVIFADRAAAKGRRVVWLSLWRFGLLFAVGSDRAEIGKLWFAGADTMGSTAETWFLINAGGRALGLMLIGVALYRLGIVQGERDDAYYRRLALWGLGVGTIGTHQRTRTSAPLGSCTRESDRSGKSRLRPTGPGAIMVRRCCAVAPDAGWRRDGRRIRAQNSGPGRVAR